MLILVIGMGFVGSEVARVAKEHGHDVVEAPHSEMNVGSINSIATFMRSRAPSGVDAVIYCVGHCPPGGFTSEIATPLSTFPDDRMIRELNMHVHGPINTFQELVEHKVPHFVFVSSAAVRLLEMPRDKRPPIHIYHHLAALAAQNALIEGMRMDPRTIEHGSLIHKVSPAAISDSPFHTVGPKSPAAVTRAEVVEAIIECLDATEHQDRVLMRQPAPTA